MRVIEVAEAIGLSATSAASGTVDEQDVLVALAGLTETDAENEDLYAAAVEQVGSSRSAGVESSVFGEPSVPGEGVGVQLRYRSEMADIFTDLAIDVGLRRHRKLVPAG